MRAKNAKLCIREVEEIYRVYIGWLSINEKYLNDKTLKINAIVQWLLDYTVFTQFKYLIELLDSYKLKLYI